MKHTQTNYPNQCQACGAHEGQPHHDPPAGWPKNRRVKLYWVEPRRYVKTPGHLECGPCKQGGDELEAERAAAAEAE